MSSKSLWASFGHALSGIGYVLWTQRSARLQLAAGVLVTLLGLSLRLSLNDWALLALSIAAVFSAEMANTVVEAVVDLLSPELHPSAKIAKDVAAGTVLIVAMTAVILGLLVLGPPLVRVILGC